MSASEVFGGIAVADYAAARVWYDGFFGRPPDLLPHDAEAAWRLTAGGWVYVVGDRERAGSGLLTILVDDLDERLDALAGRGIEPSRIETVGGGMRKAVFTDPDGNEVGLGGV